MMTIIALFFFGFLLPHLNVLLVLASEEEVLLHKNLFPSTDEYKSNILDPNTVFGNPYGGYARATLSRLASLPLRLPDMATLEEDEEDEEDTTTDTAAKTYMETSDGYGRGYVCRVYHEDSLDPSSLHDSMFDRPKLKDKTQIMHQNQQSTNDYMDQNIDEEEEEEEEERDHDLLMLETQRRLKKMEGVCSQIHLGWWSYEWCSETIVTQFHIHVSDSTATPSLALQDVTSLGKYSNRKFQIIAAKKDKADDDDDGDFPAANKYAEGEPELARVVDTYSNGDICDTTGKPRETKVKYFCCSEKMMERYRGPVLRKGNPVVSNIVSVVSLFEDPDEVCTYTITVCTPLLCENVKGADDDSLLFDISSGSMVNLDSRKAESSSSSKSESSRSLSSKKSGKKENESIRDILDRTLGKACIESSTTGWWSYSYCHRKHVKQFHESIIINTDTGIATTGAEDVYMLGFYSPELDDFPDTEEWKYVVNTTSTSGGSSGNDQSSSSSKMTSLNKRSKGVAAYFTAEYTGGDECNDPDVTDAAIKAGSVGGGHAERACSIHYSCGSGYNIYVNEDSTCHYVVEITVPELCDHPFFKAPVAKKRVVKCLPVEDASEWESSTESRVH